MKFNEVSMLVSAGEVHQKKKSSAPDGTETLVQDVALKNEVKYLGLTLNK